MSFVLVATNPDMGSMFCLYTSCVPYTVLFFSLHSILESRTHEDTTLQVSNSFKGYFLELVFSPCFIFVHFQETFLSYFCYLIENFVRGIKTKKLHLPKLYKQILSK